MTVSSVETSIRKAPLAQSRCEPGETLQRALEVEGTQLLDVPGEALEQVGTAVISRTCWHEFWLRFGQTTGPSGSNAFTRPWKPRTPSLEEAAAALSR